ncbi:hypothetical protein [Edaphobacter bradus]|uniref:hypothetical protein n=1 Tax=Edaphobacter bradus TaxID=2259016 RepID=UPI0021E0D984|nr:hypothetical protein [Edaphobacter bradus]
MAAAALGAAVLGWALERGSSHHEFSFTLVINKLPFWFLVFALFLPRVSLAVSWLQGLLIPFELHGWIPLLFAVFLPRALVLFLIYLDQGVSLWFLIHLTVAVVIWSGGGQQIGRRRRDS